MKRNCLAEGRIFAHSSLSHEKPAGISSLSVTVQSGDGDVVSKAAEALPVPRVDNPQDLPPAINAAEAMSGLPEPMTWPGKGATPRNLPVPYLDNGTQSNYAAYMRRPCVTNVRALPPGMA